MVEAAVNFGKIYEDLRENIQAYETSITTELDKTGARLHKFLLQIKDLNPSRFSPSVAVTPEPQDGFLMTSITIEPAELPRAFPIIEKFAQETDPTTEALANTEAVTLTASAFTRAGDPKIFGVNFSVWPDRIPRSVKKEDTLDWLEKTTKRFTLDRRMFLKQGPAEDLGFPHEQAVIMRQLIARFGKVIFPAQAKELLNPNDYADYRGIFTSSAVTIPDGTRPGLLIEGAHLVMQLIQARKR